MPFYRSIKIDADASFYLHPLISVKHLFI